MDLDKLSAILNRLKSLGYTARQSPSSTDHWYLSNLQSDSLLVLGFEAGRWTVKGLNQAGLLRVTELQAEVDQL